MKKEEISTNYRLTKSDNNPVRCGDNITLTRKVKSRGPGPDVVMPSKHPRKSLDERITEAIVKTVPNLISQALEPIRSDIQIIKSDIQIINTRLDRLEDFNNDQKSLNKKFSDYIESHS
jgi:hypothetical protein